MKYMKVLGQIALLCGISFLGAEVSNLLPVRIPGSIIGILILFLLIESKYLPLNWIESGANLLISELVLFFIPSAVGVVQFTSLLRDQSIGLLVTIVVSTTTILAFVYLNVELASRYRNKG